MEDGGFILQVIVNMESASNTVLVSGFLHLLFPTSWHFCQASEHAELDGSQGLLRSLRMLPCLPK